MLNQALNYQFPKQSLSCGGLLTCFQMPLPYSYRDFTSGLKQSLSEKRQVLIFMIVKASGNVKDLVKPLRSLESGATKLFKLNRENTKPPSGKVIF